MEYSVKTRNEIEYFKQYPIAEYLEKLVEEYPKLEKYIQYTNLTQYMYKFGWDILDFDLSNYSNNGKSLDEIIEFLNQYKGQDYQIIIGERDVECEHNVGYTTTYGTHQVPTIHVGKYVEEFYTYEEFKLKVDQALINFLAVIEKYESEIETQNKNIKRINSLIEETKIKIISNGFTTENTKFLMLLNSDKEYHLREIEKYTDQLKRSYIY
jgi:hypothetical protein